MIDQRTLGNDGGAHASTTVNLVLYLFVAGSGDTAALDPIGIADNPTAMVVTSMTTVAPAAAQGPAWPAVVAPPLLPSSHVVSSFPDVRCSSSKGTKRAGPGIGGAAAPLSSGSRCRGLAVGGNASDDAAPPMPPPHSRRRTTAGSQFGAAADGDEPGGGPCLRRLPTTRAELLAQLRNSGNGHGMHGAEEDVGRASSRRGGVHDLYSATARDPSAVSGIHVAAYRDGHAVDAAHGCATVEPAGVGYEAAPGVASGDTAAEVTMPNTVPSAFAAVLGSQRSEVVRDTSAAVSARRRIVGKQRIDAQRLQLGDGCVTTGDLETAPQRARVPLDPGRRHCLTGRPPG